MIRSLLGMTHITWLDLKPSEGGFRFGSEESSADGYEKIRPPDVVQLQLPDLGDVDVCREINSGELEEIKTGLMRGPFDPV